MNSNFQVLHDFLLPHSVTVGRELIRSRSTVIKSLSKTIRDLYMDYREEELLENIEIYIIIIKKAIQDGERSLRVILQLLYQKYVRHGEDDLQFWAICHKSSLYPLASLEMDTLIDLEEQENNAAAKFAWAKLVLFFLLMVIPDIRQLFCKYVPLCKDDSEKIYNPDFVTGSFVVQLISCLTLLRVSKVYNLFAMLINNCGVLNNSS